MPIDERVIITGDINFTEAAEERNSENLLSIADKPRLYVAYKQNFRASLGTLGAVCGRGGAVVEK